ncbi:MAG: superoxide dismutase [Nocardioides sp.]
MRTTHLSAPRAARLALTALLTAGLVAASAPGPVLAAPEPGGSAPFPAVLDLPDGFRPEGIAIGPGPTAYFGSLANGDIYEIALRTGEGKIISQGPVPVSPSVGLKSDKRGRLFVAGGNAGTARVVDIESGAILRSYQLTTATSFVNDVVLTRKAAWFTDSAQAQLYKLPLGPDGALPDANEIVTLPLTGEWVQGAGFGANGITATPDGKALLVINSTSGLLYRVDRTTGAATEVDLDTSLVNGDGLLLRNHTLYAVQNQLNKVAVVRLDPRGTSGTLTRTITSAQFDVPTTVARFGNRLYLPNARFTTTPTPTTPYTVTQVSAH